AWVPLPDLDAERAESEIFDAAAPATAPAEVAEPAPAPSPVEAPASDHVQQPTWQIVAPDPSPTVEAEPAPAAPGAAPSADPQWPTRPAWLGGPAAQDMPLLGRPPAVQGGIDALWAASTNEVATGPSVAGKPVSAGVQPCISCGLSLSANARFCRRCGTPQGG
ncbi:MAG: hypothetical protein QOI37_1538, partial [Chloroflexota bacterium]|nr:hypothetical protein [Chloroflexota bacterium]